MQDVEAIINNDNGQQAIRLLAKKIESLEYAVLALDTAKQEREPEDTPEPAVTTWPAEPEETP